MMSQKLLHRMKGGVWHYQLYDEGRTDSGRASSGWNPAFNLYFIHRCINFFAILVSQVRCYCNLYLLSFIVIMYWTKFLYELYSNSRVLIHYIEGHYFILFFVSIIGCHSCSYSAILIVFCTFKFSSMTLSLSLLHVHWILCYRIKNISFMVFIKQLKPRIFVQCNCCYTDWSLAF